MQIHKLCGLIAICTVYSTQAQVGFNEDGSAPETFVHIKEGTGSGGSAEPGTILFMESNSDNIVNFLTPQANATHLYFGDNSNASLGGISYFGSSNARANQMAIQTAGSEKMTILSNGNVGIGSTVPAYKFDLNGTMGISQYLYHAGDNNTYLNFTSDRLRINSGGEQMIDITEAAQDYVKLGDGGDVDVNLNDDVFVEGSSGEMGIGTTLPSNMLDINTTSTSSGIAFDGRTVLGGYSGDNYMYLNPSSSFTSGISTPSNMQVQGELRQGSTDYGAYGLQTSDKLYVNDYMVAIGGVNVGGTSDPGTNNLVVSGGLGLGGAPISEKLSVDGVIALTEQASAPTPTAGQGKVYVKTDKKLYFLDDNGTEYDLTETGGGGGQGGSADGNGIYDGSGSLGSNTTITMGSNDLLFNLNGSGQVGIGTTNATSDLHVNGSARVSSLNVNGAYTLPTTAGTSSQYLKGDGSWGTPGEPPVVINLCEFTATEAVEDRNGEITFVVPAELNGKSITKVQAKGYSGAGNVDVTFYKDATSIATLSNVGTTLASQSGLSSTISTGQIIKVNTSGLSGSLDGLILSIICSQ